MKQWFFAFALSVACVCAPFSVRAADEIGGDESGADCPRQVIAFGNAEFSLTSDEAKQRIFAEIGAYISKKKAVPLNSDLAAKLHVTDEEINAFFEANSLTMETAIAASREKFPEYFEKLQITMARAVTRHFNEHYCAPTEEELALSLGLGVDALPLVYAVPDNLGSFAEGYNKKAFKGMRARLAKAFSRVSKDLGRFATPSEMAAALDMSVDDLAKAFGEDGLFGDDDALKALSQKLVPNNFRYVMNTDIFNPERRERFEKALRENKAFLLTCAVAGIGVEPTFYQSALKLMELKDADMIVYAANMVTQGLDPVLLNNPRIHILTESAELSPWMMLDNIKLIAKQINPLMGLERLGGLGQTVIVGSPKMHVRTLPSKSTLTPKKLMTTGAITKNEYSGPSDKYIKQRTSKIAKRDHVIGALLLEKRRGTHALVDVESAGHFYARHIEFMPKAGGFVDLGMLYTPEGAKRTTIEAAVLGDIHVGMTDERLMKALRDQILKFKPKRIVLHDLMDGRSINHHEQNRLLTLAAKARDGMLDLQKEVNQVIAFVNSLLALDSSLNIVVVPSNHDAWLHNWLEAGQFMREPHNMRLGLELATYKHDGKDPFKEVLMKGIEYPKRMIFLERGQDFRVAEQNPVELGQHGDKGANGSRASLQGMGVAFGRVVYGHTHTDSRRNGSVNIATMTVTPMPYAAEGTSNWSQSLALVDSFGGIQVLEYFNGGFYSEPEEKETDPATFFYPEFPRIIPNDPDYAPGSLDQWD
ncbi:hypothetical protein K2X33_01695 [bacterium]|nr:hypothetical protein [bacterium]